MRYLFILLFLLVAACSSSNITVNPSARVEPTRQELRKAMRHHGILFAQEDDNGEWYFIRDGKRCRLFASLDNGK